ncbi:serine--tRNA synthetase-like protein Slimp [Daktulosphaira vitifoliae]|uniref:serine--tRNA synthetase-like protein Slimp n=1 Tax=Daktulosphaira vitifoliae TaxID=58002 RepID=UPI0021AA25BE|nr:serine--tRNA synthetase-like protein Slimp [Daktulosphaira vitifoliae]
MIKKLSNNFFNCITLPRLYTTSKLYIPYNKTSDTYVVVEPFVDLKNQLSNIAILKENLKLRNINLDIDNIYDKWPSFQKTRDEILKLTSFKQSIAVKLKNSEKLSDMELKKIKNDRYSISSRLKVLKKQISDLENEIVIPSLNIPNNLHPDCPKSEMLYINNFDNVISNNINKKNHLDIGTTIGCLEYKNSIMVYLKNKAAMFELATLEYFIESLEKHGFTQLCNSDMVKSVIVEGCGLDSYNPTTTLKLEADNLHLVGGANLLTLCALLTKQCIAGNRLPLKIYASGRLYKFPSFYDEGLFSTVQSNAVHYLIGSACEFQAKEQFDKMVYMYKKLYDEIGINYRIVYLPASKLENWESLKAQVELYSISNEKYYTAGTISLSNDFITKRLRIYYSNKKKEKLYLNMVSGKIVDVNVLLGCILEYNINELNIPNCIKEYMI